MESFVRNMYKLFEAINCCETNKFFLPELMLIYSGIDIVASLERRKDEGTKSSFTRWVEKYLLKAVSLPCTAIELYAARCGILHTLTSRSDLSRKGQVREVLYAWGTGKAPVLQEAARCLGYDYTVIHLSQLNEAFRKGVTMFLEEVSQEQERLKKISEGTNLWFSDLSLEIVDTYLNLSKNNENR